MSIVRNSISGVSLARRLWDVMQTPHHRVPLATHHSRSVPHRRALLTTAFRLRELGARALFASVDSSGCIETDVFIVGAEQTLKEGGKPTEQPLALAQVFAFYFCSGAVLRNLFGQTNDAEVVGDRKLNQATVQGTIPAR